ncbi:DNA cytosine methyltransferase [Segetibacter aerophilus]|uniref:DNA (cytosine-5-)-methyltransferase n=1 Tax=Segetibacter aerophilus TaxID=670293 RepID=A0A512B9U0_9BACT|nr:DNA cytosine methyltransferase [Segetibacter aerophilus]GEO08725.1 DNA methyltransferase [Segetibacter aerophilus]
MHSEVGHQPIFIIVDLFCGFGGTTTGFVNAKINGSPIAKVIACVNHDPKAIKSHWLNHPEVKHFEEDIRTLDLTELKALVEYQRMLYPDAYLILWASLECTNFSKAKGGLPRDADSRTLADHMHRYVDAISPDYIKIENVVEFMSWGPLDENGKPLSRKNGSDWMRWRREMCAHGYNDEWRELNSADFGAYTSRNRLFGCFARYGLPIVWPAATHSKKPSVSGMYGDLKKWNAVKDVLDFEDEGVSIFNRKKDLSEKTLERIYAGLIKYVAKGDTSFISKYYSGRPAAKNKSIDNPVDSITTVDHRSLVQADFLLKYNYINGKTGRHHQPSVQEPCSVVSTQVRLGLVQPEFIASYYGNGHNISSVGSPAPTIPTKDRCALVQPQYLINYNYSSHCNDVNSIAPTLLTRDKLGLVKPEYFIDKTYTGYRNNQSIEAPAGAILPTDKHRLIEAQPFIMPTNYDNGPKSIEDPSPTITANRKHHYLINPAWGGNGGDVERPCCVIVARQDKAPLYFVQVEAGDVSIAVYEGDSEMAIKIKSFMASFGLVDIKMRMLRVVELLRIQGFPENYKMTGNQSDHKKFIGNSVHPKVPKAWAEALGARILETKNLKVA